jgi:hypothetical protein
MNMFAKTKMFVNIFGKILWKLKIVRKNFRFSRTKKTRRKIKRIFAKFDDVSLDFRFCATMKEAVFRFNLRFK